MASEPEKNAPEKKPTAADKKPAAAAEPATKTRAETEGMTKAERRKAMKLKHARVAATDREDGGSKRFAVMRREKKEAKRQETGTAKPKRPLSREESDNAARAVEDTVKELMAMGFDEAAAREATNNAKLALSAAPAAAAPAAAAPAVAPKAKRQKKGKAAVAQGPTVAPERTFNIWTAEQLEILNAAAAEQGLTDATMDDRWVAVAEKVGNGRSASACRHRWAAFKEGKGAPVAAEADTVDEAPVNERKLGGKKVESTWKPREDSKIFIGNAKALGGEEEVVAFFAAADDGGERLGGVLTDLQWLSGKAEGSCFARCGCAAAAAAAIESCNGAKVTGGQTLLVQAAHEVNFKTAVHKVKKLRGGDSKSSLGPATTGPVPKGCRVRTPRSPHHNSIPREISDSLLAFSGRLPREPQLRLRPRDAEVVV